MSRAFTKESDENEWLHEIAPTMNALIRYLTKENNGVSVYEKRNFTLTNGVMVHEMNNGLCYALDEDRRWTIVEV